MTIVVTGATGNVGRPLVAELAAAGARVRAVTRTPETAGFPAGRRGGRLGRRRAAGGVGGVPQFPRAGPRTLPDVVAQCRRAGVTKLVALSAINADDDFSRQPSRFRGDRNKEVEQLAVDSGLAWVSLRPTVFATNFAGMWSAQIRAGDVVAGPYAAASTAPIVESDIAAVAARALLTDELVGQRIPLTGPQAFTNAELVEVIGAVLGRPLQYREIPAGRGAATVHRLGLHRRVRRRLHGHARRDARQTRPGHPRRGEDPRPAGRARSRSGCPSTATCSPKLDTREGDLTCPNHVRRATSNP